MHRPTQTIILGETIISDFTAANEPFALFADWFTDAKAKELNDPNAMSLATVDADGLPNSRVVLLKGLDDEHTPNRGFVFYTNLNSAKGRELFAQPLAALLFHWKSLQRQIRIRGKISSVSDAEADAYFATRNRGSRIGAWASDQSQPLLGRETLEERVAEVEKMFDGKDVTRPQHWSGFRLTPKEIEFWQSGEFRLHNRIVFRRENETQPWSKTRLYP